jgi:hypothetical protein
MDKYLIIKKTGKGSDHNEKVNKCKQNSSGKGHLIWGKTLNSGNGLFSQSG